jgi:hypothetical protein
MDCLFAIAIYFAAACCSRSHLRVRKQAVMQQVHGVEQHSGSHGPGQRHGPAATTLILRAFPHGALHREGDKQAKGL